MTERQSVDDLLIAHAVGKLPEPVCLAVATHLALNPVARARYRGYEAFGGVLLDELEPESLAPNAWARMEALLDAESEVAPATDQRVPSADRRVPRPLRDYLPGPLESLRWRFFGPAAEIELPVARCPAIGPP